MSTAAAAAATPAPAPPEAPPRSATKTAALLAAAALGVLVGIWQLGLLVTKVLARSGLGAADARVDATLVRERTSTLNHITRYASAETLTISTLAAILFVVLRLTLRRWRESVFLGATLVGEVLIVLGGALLGIRWLTATATLLPRMARRGGT